MKKLQKTSYWLGVCLTVLLAVGCGQKLEQGEIVGKRYEPAREFIMFIPIITSCGKGCTSTMLIPYWVHDDEDYIITVKGMTDDGELITEDWYVTKAQYDNAEPGRLTMYDERTASRDDEHEKLRKANS